MKIELFKDEELNGSIMWVVRVDGITDKCFWKELEALEYYNLLCRKASEGYPKRIKVKEFKTK